MNYYNEHDPFAVEWLRDLITAGVLAPGHVDERSIEDVTPNDLRGYIQCHFFVGIGVWPFALRSVGWPDNRPIWTGSAPCQPFSAAGARGGFDDKRHLWPAQHWLIDQHRPPVFAGEQVASPDGLGWFDLVSTDLEGSGYAVGAADLCAAGVGVEWEESQAGEWLRRAIRDCPDPRLADQLRDFADWAGGELGDGGFHIRQRNYFVALADAACSGGGPRLRDSGQAEQRGLVAPDGSRAYGLDDGERAGSQGHTGNDGAALGRGEPERPASEASISSGLADGAGGGWGKFGDALEPGHGGHPNGGGDAISRLADSDSDSDRRDQEGRRFAPAGTDGPFGNRTAGGANPDHGERRDADWLLCRDGKWRATEPGTFPLAYGTPGRVGRLRGYGNALDFRTAKTFLQTIMEITDYSVDGAVNAL